MFEREKSFESHPFNQSVLGGFSGCYEWILPSWQAICRDAGRESHLGFNSASRLGFSGWKCVWIQLFRLGVGRCHLRPDQTANSSLFESEHRFGLAIVEHWSLGKPVFTVCLFAFGQRHLMAAQLKPLGWADF
ncbi:MAG: hypothetical protein CMH52_04640 [Myxococcales bacterium]|nr:hypothetical protein [Myxococcales bacterium]